jgi:uncharacterized protein (TIGR00297 family)
VLARALIGGLLSIVVTLIARTTQTLSRSGAIAAAIVGTICFAAGWSWGALLFAFFASSSALSKLGKVRKAEIAGRVVGKGDERDFAQVLANGGFYATAALGHLLVPSPAWLAMAAGSLAASTADTWATEVGTLAAAEPVSIITGKQVPAGTSGGLTLLGTAAAIAGGLFIGAAATLAHWPVPFAAVVLGGIAGALADSILGATVQARRWCDLCAMGTERFVHSCGTQTRHAGGFARFDNDGVNAVCSAIGALVALILS